jgi:S-adenosylmethionine:tRNA ribosyltransferase-isomerase
MYLLDDYDYELPGHLIAQYPEPNRDQSRLLHLRRENGGISHHRFSDLDLLLRPGDLLVVNNTEVVPARLMGKKKTGGNVELFILDYAEGVLSLASKGCFECSCLINASKKTRSGALIQLDLGLCATVTDSSDGVFRVKFSTDPRFIEKLHEIGRIPLPPYIRRDTGENGFNDAEAYQTVYASRKGAGAAPTAGLHFTLPLLQKLKDKGINITEITLHVGYGTFVPVRVADIREHQVHSERFSISEEAASAINAASRVIAVGTTSVRTLEYASTADGQVHAGEGRCDLFIYPGYNFKRVDAMITNYHLPRSTLLMLVSAFAGKDLILAAYRDAIERGYRFYSYGDAMLID